MFGARKGTPESEPTQESASPAGQTVSSPARAVAETGNLSPRTMPAQIAVAPRRVIDIPSAVRRSTHSPLESDSRASESSRTLRVGKGLSVAGEITSCDILIVEGKVEAKLNDGKMIEITESGQFRGSVEIENADIAGRYDGQLVVHGRLTVRSTGRVSGMIKYGELEINAGGQIIGEMQVTGGAAGANAPVYNKSTGKFSPYADEQEDPHAPRGERRSA